MLFIARAASIWVRFGKPPQRPQPRFAGRDWENPQRVSIWDKSKGQKRFREEQNPLGLVDHPNILCQKHSRRR